MGMYLNNMSGSQTAPQIVANNMIRSGHGAYYSYGMYLVNSGFVKFVHNTVAKHTPANYGYYGIYITGAANSIVNNIFYDPNGSPSYYNMYYSGSFAVAESDYNNVYSKQNFGYLNAVYGTMTAWRAGTGFDMHSTTINPGYTNYDSMRTCKDSLDGTGTPLSYISDDIDGDGRHPLTPDVGADEWIGSAPGSYSAGPDAYFCSGGSVVIGLPATGASFVWSTLDSTATIEVSTAGTYTVTVTSACGAQHEDTVIVTDATPTAGFNTFVSYHSGKFTNTSVNGNSYMWVVHTNPPDTFYTTDLLYLFGDNGPYNIDLYVFADCDTVMISDTWAGFVGIEDSEFANMITLSPNPASDLLNISFEGVEGDVRLEMSNVQGQLVYTENYASISNTAVKSVDVSSLNKGMYILRFVTASAVATKQVVVR
jgi:hypothetical protein